MTTIINIIVIIPHIYPVPCNKPIRTNCKEEGSSFTALSHIFCVLRRSRIRWNAFGTVLIILLHICCVHKWSGTNSIMHDLLRTASLHISCVLKWPVYIVGFLVHLQHPFGFKTIRDRVQLSWVFFNCLFAHFLCLKMIRDIGQGVWFSAHCLFTHIFCLKMVWYVF